jgi:Fe-S-cluster-containing dehydrogenase component
MLDRRAFLSGAGAGGAACAAADPAAALTIAREAREMSPDAVGMLFDSTLCIGCQACVDACRSANGVAVDDTPFALAQWNGARQWDVTADLDGRTLNVIKVWRDGTAETKDSPVDGFAFMKRHCLHCVDPSCVSVCPVSAMRKDAATGIVSYDPDACIGCRYCSYGCPFGVPQFDLSKPIGKINKCEMCRHLQAEGKIPACCDVCPTGASLFGPVAALQAEADRRLAVAPGAPLSVPRGDIRQDRPRHDRIAPTYVQHVYGETEAGGTQVRYLSGVPHEKLGLPVLAAFAPARLSEGVQHTVYRFMLAPLIAFAAVAWFVRRAKAKAAAAPEEH